MQETRILVSGPVDGTFWSITVNGTSSATDLTTPPYADLLASIKQNVPLEITAEGANVYYKGAVASGVVDDQARTVPTGGAPCHVKFSNQPAPLLDRFPGNVTFLLAKAAAGATGTLRIRRA